MNAASYRSALPHPSAVSRRRAALPQPSALACAARWALIGLLPLAPQAWAQSTDAGGGEPLTAVISARNRAEQAQDVPIPVTVLSGKSLEQTGATTVTDFTTKVPNLLVNAPNARQTSIALRGLGKNSANDSMEASVGVIVDNVIASHVGMSWANFIDVDRVEVARGPQGTLLGKNTTLGVMNIVTRAPSFVPQTQAELLTGDRKALGGKFSSTGALVEGLAAYRATLYVEHRDGTLNNIAQSGEAWGETQRIGGRFQVLLTPSEDLSARLILEQGQSQERINIQPYAFDPQTWADGTARTTTYSSRLARAYFGGYQPLIGNTDTIDTNDARPLLTVQRGVSAEVTKTLAGGHKLTSITAWRSLDFDAKNDGDQTHFSITRNGTLLHAKQVSQELRLSSPTGGAVDWQVGALALRSTASSTSRTLYGGDAGAFYASNAQYATLAATASGQVLLKDSLRGIFLTTETTPSTTSLAGFGQLNWHIDPRTTLTAGLRETHENKANTSNKLVATNGATLTAANYASASAAELSAANAIRSSQLGTVYGLVNGSGLNQNAISWLLSPSYKLDDNLLVYASTAYGEKSGAVQFDSKGGIANVKPEKALDFELGAKSLLLDRKLLLNVNLYQTNVRDYQAQIQQVDASSSTGYSTALANVDKVRTRGVELDAAYSPSRALTLAVGAAVNDARYVSYANATCAGELNTSLPCDYSGRTLPYAPRVTLNVGASTRAPIGGGLTGELLANTAFRTRTNLDTTLSENGWQGGYAVTDLGASISAPGNRWSLALLARNAFDKVYATSIGNFSNSAGVGTTLADRRAINLTFRTQL